MKKIFIFLSIFLSFISGKMPQLHADQFEYQNFNHGYCPTCDKCGCNPCSCPASMPSAPDQLPPPTPPPCTNPTPAAVPPPVPAPCAKTPCNTPCAASVSGKTCGISIWAIGIAIAAICAAAAIIVSSGNGSVAKH